MKIVLVGNNDGPLRLARSLKSASVEIVLIGLQKRAWPKLKAQYIQELPENSTFLEGFKEQELAEILEKYKFDWLINCFCNFKFTVLLKRYKVLNVHLSPLPKYRGRHPLHWALINGEKTFGSTIHKMNENFDAGEIYAQVKIEVPKKASVKQLRERLMLALEAEFPKFISKLAQEQIEPKLNSDAEASYISRRYPADSELIEWNDPERIVRKVYALASEEFPAFIQLKNEKIAVFNAESLNEKEPSETGVRVLNQHENALTIVARNGTVICFGSKK